MESGNMSFDYIIVGGGTAGCVLASRLTEDPSVSVLMLEAGPNYRGLSVKIPGALGAMYDKGSYHWDYESLPETHADNKTLPYKFGKILGGSSSINGLVWVRGNSLDYDQWAESGCSGWSYSEVEPYFRQIESFEDSEDPWMGRSGPIHVSRGDDRDSVLNQAFLNSAREAGHRINSNYNGSTQDGFCVLHQNTVNGQRSDIYDGYLAQALSRHNLVVKTGVRAEKIEINTGKVSGVRVQIDGEAVNYSANREVLLCAGPIASPHLLQVSGIGAQDILGKAKIKPNHHLLGVGQNFHTHPTIKFTYRCKRPVSIYPSTTPIGKLLAGLKWFLNRSGPASSNNFEVGAFLKSQPDLDKPDLQLTFLPLALGDLANPIKGHGFQIYIELIGCKSRGSLNAISPDIHVNPEFRFNFLEDERDIKALLAGIDVVRNLVSQPAFQEYCGAELEPGNGVQSEEQKVTWLREIASLSHHIVGGCKMGPSSDPLAVVDPELRVHGIDGLRVVDASIMPIVTSGNTHAPVIMIAEKAADMIRNKNH